jgi:UPF0755 protein
MKPYSLKGRHFRKWPRVLLVFIVLFVFVGVGGILVTRRLYLDNLKPVNVADSAQKIFVIPSGASVDDIAGQLHGQKLIRSVPAFKQYVRSKQVSENFKAGTYRLSPSQSVGDIVTILTEGKIAIDLFTILPGRRIDQIRQDFIAAGFSAAAVDKALDPANYAGHAALVDKPVGASLEGYLYPDSFQKTADTDPGLIISASLNEMSEHLTPALRADYAKEGLTTHQAITLASIIEREVASQADRATAAQVFFKRLSVGMQLGSDVTAIYGAVLDNVDLPDNYARAAEVAIAHDSPYNTRMHAGLPPGPISNVTKSGLEAVAKPAGTDYLYFVAGDDGITYFSKTNEEHEALIQQHCKELCGR